MESGKWKEDIYQFHKMCIQELQKATTFMQLYLEKVDEIFTHVDVKLDNCAYNTEEFLIVYDAALADLTYIADIIRKFNISCEIGALEFDRAIAMRKERGKYIERFTYPKPNMTKYKSNYEGSCVITYVKNKEEGLFYMNEIENAEHMNCVELLKNYSQRSPKKFNGIPKDGEVFGLYMKGYTLRAVRENDQYSRSKLNDFWNAYLIDVGEIIKVTPEMDTYSLPSQYVELPSQAILCKLEMINSNKINLEKYFSNILCTKHKFVVRAKIDSILHVTLIVNTNPFVNSFVETEDKGACENTRNMDSFYQYLCVNKDINDLSDKHCGIEDNKNSKVLFSNAPFHKNIEQTVLHKNIQHSSQNFCPTTDNVQQNEKLYSKISTYDTNSNILDSAKVHYPNQNFQISNRMSPQDFYAAILNKSNSTSSNSRNSSSTEMNTQPRYRFLDKENNTNEILGAGINETNLQDGDEKNYTNNEVTKNFEYKNLHPQILNNNNNSGDDKPIMYVKNTYAYPLVGQLVTLTPTHIVNVNQFFAHHHTHESRYQYTLTELIRQMNKPEEIKTYSLIKRPLKELEFVIAMYKDGFWYRARVMQIYDEISIRVFYLDYGNSDLVSVHQIRKWESRFESLPFQAIACRIAGIKNTSLSIAGLERLKKMILQKSLKAKIIKVSDKVFDVKLTNMEGYDIADQLVLFGYATK